MLARFEYFAGATVSLSGKVGREPNELDFDKLDKCILQNSHVSSTGDLHE